MKLVAQWGDVKAKTKVTYKPGVGGSGSDKVIDALLINDKIKLLSLGDSGITAKDGYEFAGWKNETDGKIYQPGIELQVDNTGANPCR